jgi:Calcineurin-like phosphoesterase
MTARGAACAAAVACLAVLAGATAPAAAERVELRPTWDAGLSRGLTADGRARSLALGPRRAAVLRFDLRAVAGRIRSARLVVRVRGSRSALRVARARVSRGRVLRAERRGVRGAPRRRGLVAFDVTARVHAGARVTLLLYARGRKRSRVLMRESGRARGPRLTLDVLRPSGPAVAPAPPAPPPPPPAASPPPDQASPGPAPAPGSVLAPAAEPAPPAVTVAAAGDIAHSSLASLEDDATAAVVGELDPDAVLALGDLAYESGTPAEFQTFYEPSWGRHKSRTHPVPGNHEYQTPGARGYFDYFNGAGAATGPAGERGSGWYSFDLGSWHVVALNSNCGEVGGCGPGSVQEQWLRRDLAATSKPCTLAFWHHPRFASGSYTDDPTYVPFWRALHDFGAEVVLNGHEHNYQRYAPLDPDGRPDAARGIRELVVGTGGRQLRPVLPSASNREAANADTHGVLELTLASEGYEWSFRPVAGGTYADAGSGACH